MPGNTTLQGREERTGHLIRHDKQKCEKRFPYTALIKTTIISLFIKEKTTLLIPSQATEADERGPHWAHMIHEGIEGYQRRGTVKLNHAKSRDTKQVDYSKRYIICTRETLAQ